MSARHFSFVKPKELQRGAAAVEFALVMVPFFLLLLGAMEFGRLLYLWNTVQEVTRRAARQAVVSQFDKNTVQNIQRSAVFLAPNVNGALPAAPEITNAKVVIRYLRNADGDLANPLPKDAGDNSSACLDVKRVNSCIRFVEVCVSKGNSCAPDQLISFIPMISIFSQSGPFSTDLTGLKIPLSTVRMPAESLGLL